MPAARRSGTVIGLAALLASAAPHPAQTAWAFPGFGPPMAGEDDEHVPITVPGSPVTVTEVRLHDPFDVVDWRPESHAPAPDAVMKGAPPERWACAYCHTPGGSGRPENASLAGLPADYILAQVAAYRDGSRQAVAADWTPARRMIAVARAADPALVAEAARYFSAQPHVLQVRVVETATVPKTVIANFIAQPVAGGAREALGTRILEVPDDVERFERRDPATPITAYVPEGSIARGAALVENVGCLACYAETMQDAAGKPWGPGRSPGYIVRQLLAFQAGSRGGPNAVAMQEVASGLSTAEMIDAAAYLASRQP